MTLAEKMKTHNWKQTLLIIAAGIVIATLSFMYGRSRKDEYYYSRHLLHCQMLGDTHRDSWRRILTDDTAMTNALALYRQATNGTDDIRIIIYSLEHYLRNPSEPPDDILDLYREEFKRTEMY